MRITADLRQMQSQKGMRFVFRDDNENGQAEGLENIDRKVEGNEMRRIEVYDATADWLEELAEKNDTTVAEVVMALVEQFSDELEM